MEKIQSIHLRRLHGQMGELVYQLTKVQFSRFSTAEGWQPAINAYRCEDGVAICVDLAGVDCTDLNIEIVGRRLLIQGRRQAPEPDPREKRPVQVLAMEIDYGPFQREVVLPCDVEAARVRAEQRNGLLWIHVPLRCEG